MDKLRKDLKIPVGSMLFAALLLIGVWIGCLFVLFSPEQFVFVGRSVLFNGLFADTAAGWHSVFSAFLFDFLFYLLLVFFFGMTFLGTVVIPATVFVRGFTLGASLSALLAAKGTGVYFQHWLTYLPAAVFCALVFLVFSGHSFGSALKSAAQLFNREAAPVSFKSCGMQFLLALLLFVCAAAVRCGCVFLAAIFL